MDEELGFEVRWAIAGDSIVVQLVAKLDDGEYMSFGLSGEEGRNVMVGGDVVVAWVDHNTFNGYAVDYFLDAKSQCSGNRGSCPDNRIEDNTETVRLLNAALVNGYSIVTFQRPLKAHDSLDKAIITNGSQAVIWAIGPLNSKQEVSYHTLTSKGTVVLDFGRQPSWNCPIPEQDATAAMSGKEEEEVDIRKTNSISQNTRTRYEVTTYKSVPPPATVAPAKDVWDIPPIQCNEPEDGVFYAQMGPTGGKRGYSAITGHVGWGISYYINGLLIPEINVVRGRTYTFVVEGGLDPETPAKFHPFYITDDSVGGYEHKTPQERSKVRIFAGVDRNKKGDIIPTGIGRLCNWTPDPDQPLADEFASFGAYQRTLTLICDHGEPGVIQWTPDENTPDTVYYQCFTHRYLGWKINVHDRCDYPVASASEQVSSRIKVDLKDEDSNDELQSRPSIRVATRVLPNSYSVTENGKSIEENYYKTLEESPVNFKDGLSQQGADAFSYPYKPDPEKNGGYEITFSNYFNGYDQDYKNLGEKIPSGSEEVSYETTTIKHVETSPTSSYKTNSTGAYYAGASYLPTIVQTTSLPTYQTNQKPRRPAQVMTFVRPHRPVPPIMLMAQQGMSLHRPLTLIPTSTQQRPLVVKKPIYRMPVVSVPRPSLTPTNTIASRPVQQPTIMIPTGQQQQHVQRAPSSQVTKSVSVSYSSAKVKKPIPYYTTDATKLNKAETKKRNPALDSSSYGGYSAPFSSGFNPGTVVLESGFKPIIQNTDAEKRVSNFEVKVEKMSGAINTDFNEEIQEEEAADRMDTESEERSDILEPIFVPSPLDSLQKPMKKQSGEELSSSKKKLLAANKPVRQNIVVIRRRPVFTEAARSQSDSSQDEIAMAAEQMDTYYLPPSGPIYGVSSSGRVAIPAKPEVEGASIVTYDGKTVLSNSGVVPPPPPSFSRGSSVKRPKGSADLVRNTPQFAPFKGDAPPPVPEHISPENIPQLHSGHDRPEHSAGLPLRQLSPGKTKLSLIRNVEDDFDDTVELSPEASEIKEYVTVKNKTKSNSSSKKDSKESLKKDEKIQKYKDVASSIQEEDSKPNSRRRRSPHEGHNHDHDHLHHQNTTQPSKSEATLTSVHSFIVVAVTIMCSYVV